SNRCPCGQRNSRGTKPASGHDPRVVGGDVRHHVGVHVVHHPQRAGQHDDHQDHGEHQREHVPAAFRPRVHVQEVDHLHHDLDHGEGEYRQGGGAWVLHYVAHLQPERYGGEVHRQHEADDVVAHAAMRAFLVGVVLAAVLVVGMAVGHGMGVVGLAHGSTPIR